MKKLLALFLVVLMSIESFGAVVGDNDGSAFITKAEFDSLKNDFQSQIDQYNTSIDSKIDGAIASYLAGIKLDKVETETPLCYFDGEHIISLRENYTDINWNEGMMSITMRIDYLTSTGSNEWTTGWIGVNGKTPTAFTELAIGNLKRDTSVVDNSRAIWKGLTKKKYTLNLMGYNKNTAWHPGTIATTLYVGPGYGVCSISNSINYFLYSTGTGAGHGQLIAPVYGTTTSNAWSYSEYSNYYSIIEDLVETTKEHIIVNKSNICKRFTNYDGYTDWSYDSDGYGADSIHTQWTNGNQLFADGYVSEIQEAQGGARAVKNVTTNAGNTHVAGGRDSEFPWHRVLPWNGFVKELVNWNQIATSDYDNLATRLKSKFDTNSYYEDANKKLHLLISAGVPIYFNETNADKDISFNVEFADKTKNYALFFKDSPFIRNLEPSNDANIDNNIVIKGSDENGPNAAKALFNNSVLCENGEQKYRITVAKGKCLFMKWQYNDNGTTGGGEFISPKDISVYTK